MDLQELWRSCLDRFDRPSSQETENDDWVKLVADLTLCGRMVESLGLFSRNETIEEASTASLPFMMVQYMTGMASQRIKTESKEDRRFLLMGAKSCLEEFMGLLGSYGVYRVEKKQTDPMALRTAKIERMRRILALEKGIVEGKAIMAVRSANDLETDAPPSSFDEETMRTFHLNQLTLCALRTEQELPLIEAELDILKQSGDGGPDEKRPAAEPKPSNVRKVMQPFTLFASKRDQIRAGVFRPGHNLPTMTIDEYLELERQRGGIIEGGGPSSGAAQESEDEDAWQDDEERRQKDVRMDAYRDDHRRGSGNTYNRG